ncbi:MAG: helix-turn-helix transcriptional regulator [Thermomicrobiales bacterium]
MARLTKVQALAKHELRLAAESGLLPPQLASKMMTSLERAIGWDGFRLFGVDQRTLLINRLLAASENDSWARREWLQDVYLAEETLPYIQLPTILRTGLRGVAYQERQEISYGYPAAMLSPVSPNHHWRYFYESQSPVGGVLLAGFAHGKSWVAVMQAYRRDPAKPFRPGDVEFLKHAGSVIGPALGQALARERAMTVSAAPPGDFPRASGIVMVSAERELMFATPAGEAWLELLHSGDRKNGNPLPTALWSASMSLKWEDANRFGTSVQAMTPAGPVTIEPSAADHSGAVALVITPQQSPQPHPVPDHWPLTDQQRQIVLLIATGLTNRQIAESLFVGEHTIEWHIGQIFSRLDVRSRTQLVARYFQEAVLGHYRDPAEDYSREE